MSYRTSLASPNRLLTLTVDPARYTSPRHAFDETARLVPELIKKLRKRFGEVEYLRVTELHRSGYPHYHLLVRSGFLPQPVVKKLWQDLTGADIVDLRAVDKNWNSYRYLLKYLSKMHHIDWTERHLSYSRGFFPHEEKEPRKKSEYRPYATVHTHPYVYLLNHYWGRTLLRPSPYVWRIHDGIGEYAEPTEDSSWPRTAFDWPIDSRPIDRTPRPDPQLLLSTPASDDQTPPSVIS